MVLRDSQPDLFMCLLCRGLQTLGLAGLGMSSGFERLHYLLEYAFDADGDLSSAFLKACGLLLLILGPVFAVPCTLRSRHMQYFG